MKRIVTISCVLLLIGAGAARLARSQSEGRSIQSRKYGAVTLLRVINTAEMEHQTKQKRFGTFTELVELGSLDAAGERYGHTWKALSFDRQATAEPLDEYAMHFTVDAAGKMYSVSLTDKSDYSSFFTDERGLIYEAKPIQ